MFEVLRSWWTRRERPVRRALVWLTDRLPARVIRGPDGAPFLERFHVVRAGPIELVIHRFINSDPDRGFHDHPYAWAGSLVLAGGYDELIVPSIDAPRAQRRRRRLSAPAVNRIAPTRFHRVLLAPGGDAWTLFVTGPRVKTWGFLAHPRAHRYAAGGASPSDHYDRTGIAREIASSGDAYVDETTDASYGADTLEYRTFTDAIAPADPDWAARAPTGAELRRTGAAVATPRTPILAPHQTLLLLSGRQGAGKDFVAELLARELGPRVHLVRIGDATKQIYGARTGVAIAALVGDRAVKDAHRAGLTQLYDELRADDEQFELRRAFAEVRAHRDAELVCIVDLRMRYELAAFRDAVPPERLAHVRVTAGAAARARRGIGEADPHHPTETDLVGEVPDLVFANEVDGAAATWSALREHLGALFAGRGVFDPSWSDVRAFLARSLSHDAAYDCDVLGRTFRVHPQVMSPRYSYSPTFVIRHWDPAVFAGATVLDMGCGCGVLAVFAALAGAARVVAVDIDPEAVRITRHNASRNGVADRVDAHVSNAFAEVSGRFDVIVFNPPYFDHMFDPAVPLTRAVFDPGHVFLDTVLREAPAHLAPGGRLVCVLGSAGLAGAPLGDAELDARTPLRLVAKVSETRGHLRTLYTFSVR